MRKTQTDRAPANGGGRQSASGPKGAPISANIASPPSGEVSTQMPPSVTVIVCSQ